MMLDLITINGQVQLMHMYNGHKSLRLGTCHLYMHVLVLVQCTSIGLVHIHTDGPCRNFDIFNLDFFMRLYM